MLLTHITFVLHEEVMYCKRQSITLPVDYGNNVQQK